MNMKWYFVVFFLCFIKNLSLSSIIVIETSCYRRFVSGKRLDERFVRHSLPCDTIQACQHQCSVEQHFECHGFNIRLDENRLGRGICELTSVPSIYLDVNNDFHRDVEFDFYEKDLRNTSPNCGYVNEVVSVIPKIDDSSGSRSNPPTRGGGGRKDVSSGQIPWNRGQGHIPGRHHPNEIPTYGNVVPKDRYHNRDWHHARAMPFDPPVNRLPGYIIIDSNRDRGGERQQGRQVPYPQFSSNLSPGPSDNFHGLDFGMSSQKQNCFQRRYPASRIHSNMVREYYTMESVTQCESMCLKAKFHCMGFTYRYSRIPDTSANCFLTDLSTIDPYGHLVDDRNCDVYYRMPMCQQVSTFSDTECFTKDFTDTTMSLEIVKIRVSSATVTECELECLRVDFFVCRSFSFNKEGGENCWLSDWPVKSLTPNQLMPSQRSHVFGRGSFGRGCELDFPGISFSNYPNPGIPTHPMQPYPQQPRQWHRDAWKHFTVRGWPCRKGTQCSLNRDAGFWSCEVEGGDFSQWDYCCRPQHACGFSQGFNYPWCYVGEAGPDQWRPCSDHFYPHYEEPHHKPPSYLDYSSQTAWSDEYGPPSSWPVSYLYSHPPPNETIYYETPETPIHSNLDTHHTYYGDSPKIKFKPSTPAVFPKAVVQKLDIKDASANSDVPENNDEDPIIVIHPRNNFAKKLKVDDSAKFVFATSGTATNNDTISPNFILGTSLAEIMASLPQGNTTATSAQINKTKELLETIERIIANNTKENNCTTKSDESLVEKSSEGLAYSRGFINTSQAFQMKNGESAMTNFWNWGQANYFSKDSKT